MPSLQEASYMASILGSLVATCSFVTTVYIGFKAQKISKQVNLANTLYQCNTRFSQIHDKGQGMDGDINPHSYYTSFWALQYDQFQYWQEGIISDRIYQDWSKARQNDWKYNPLIGKISYRDGFNFAIKGHQNDLFIKYINYVHNEGPDYAMKSIRKKSIFGKIITIFTSIVK